MIIATFVAPAARSQSGQPSAQIWVSAMSLHSADKVGQWKETRLDDADQWKPEARCTHQGGVAGPWQRRAHE
jgi:hypothetical protein